jgi:outer membrane autotransporter protein
VQSDPVSSAADQSNTEGVAEALDAIIASGLATGELQSLIFQLGSFTSADQLNDALATLAPNVNGAILEQFNWLRTMFDSVVMERMIHRGSIRGVQGHNYGDDPERPYGAWVKLLGQYAEQDERHDIDGFHDNVWGIAIGGDLMISEQALMGLALSYSHLNAENVNIRASTNAKSYQATLYGDYEFICPWYVNWLAAAAYNDYDAQRTIEFLNVTLHPESDFHGWQWGAKAEVGYDHVEGPAHLIPLVSLYYSHLDVDGYTETGAGTANQTVDENDFDLLQGGIGIRFAYDCPFDIDVIQPEFHAMAFYNFVNDRFETTSEFTGAGPSFTTAGARPPRGSYNLGVSLATFNTDRGMVFSASYDFYFKEDYESHAGFVRMRYEW